MVWQPLWAAMLYAATAGYADGFAASQWLGSSPFFDTAMNLLILALLVRVALTPQGGLNSRLIRQAFFVAAIFTGWIVTVTMMKGGSLHRTGAFIAYSGIPFFIVWLARGRLIDHRRAFRFFVGTQILLATLVLLIPALSVLNGETYLNVLGLPSDVARSGVSVAIPGSSTAKEALGHYGQFHNPNALGFYSCIALACGASLLTSARRGSRLLGLAFLASGGICWLNSLTRGPFAGVIVGLAIALLLRSRHHLNERQRLAVGLATLIGIACAVLLINASGLVDYIIPSSNNISVTGRIGGYRDGFRALSDHLWLGVPVDWTWNAYPHFLPLLYGALFGLVGGLLMFWIGMILPGRAVLAAWRLPCASDTILVTTLCLACIGIAATDNLTAPGLFGFCVAEAVLVVSGTRSPERVIVGGHEKLPRGGHNREKIASL